MGLKFRDRELLQQALVHRSLLNEQGGRPEDSYERLEYLGDAVLELTVSTELFRRFPVLNEGALTKLRSALVRGESLAKVARRLSLGDFLLLGKGEESSGGRQRDSILAAAFEAVVAAVYLDQGFDQASRSVEVLVDGEVAGAGQGGKRSDAEQSAARDALSRIQSL